MVNKFKSSFKKRDRRRPCPSMSPLQTFQNGESLCASGGAGRVPHTFHHQLWDTTWAAELRGGFGCQKMPLVLWRELWNRTNCRGGILDKQIWFYIFMVYILRYLKIFYWKTRLLKVCGSSSDVVWFVVCFPLMLWRTAKEKEVEKRLSDT